MMIFLFTDIENSTPLWEQFTNTMWQVLNRHDAILHECLERYGGQLVKHTGDGLFAIFENREALACGFEMQRRIQQEDWGIVGPLLVRIVLHAGEARRMGDDFFGPDVNTAARLLSICRGGEVLFTERVLKVCPLPEGASTVDMGFHNLRGVSEPQHVYLLQHPDLPTRDTPLERVIPSSQGPLQTTCPACGTTNLPNTLFCDECGHDLHVSSSVPLFGSGEEEHPRLLLQVLPYGPTIRVPNTGEAVFGRGSTGLGGGGFINLEPVGGLSAGVSRRHARLFEHEGHFYLEDLGSTNGSFVNNHRLRPYEPVPVKPGDVISLGLLRLKLLHGG